MPTLTQSNTLFSRQIPVPSGLQVEAIVVKESSGQT